MPTSRELRCPDQGVRVHRCAHGHQRSGSSHSVAPDLSGAWIFTGPGTGMAGHAPLRDGPERPSGPSRERGRGVGPMRVHGGCTGARRASHARVRAGGPATAGPTVTPSAHAPQGAGGTESGERGRPALRGWFCGAVSHDQKIMAPQGRPSGRPLVCQGHTRGGECTAVHHRTVGQ